MSRHFEQVPVDVPDFWRYAELSRRSALKAGLSLGAGVLGADILAACGGSSKAPTSYNVPTGHAVASSTPVAAPKAPQTGALIPTPRNQTVIVDNGVYTAMGSYNPYTPNGWDLLSGHIQVLAESLFYLNLVTGELIKWQATGWTYNSDYTQITLHLNPDVHWNDGQPFTSSDVKFTLEMLKGNTGLAVNGLMLSQIKSITTPDDHTAVINLNVRNTRYHYHFINAVVNPDLIILPAHIWSKHDPTTFLNNPPVFTGPYKLKEANRTLQYYLWEKDPKYWNKANFAPKPRYVAYRLPAVVDAEAAEFRDAQFDQGAPLITTQALIQSGYKKAIIATMIDPCPKSIQINCDPSRGITADPRFRAAISALVDRETAAKSISVPATTPATFPWPAYGNMKRWEDGSVAGQYQLSYDPQKAGQMLDAMGATKDSSGKRTWQGKPISLSMIATNLNSVTLMGQMLQKALQTQGMDCNFQILPGAVYSNQLNRGQFDILSAWGPCSTMDPYQSYALVASSNYAPVGTAALNGDQVRLKDSTMDNLIDELANDNPTSSASQPIFKQALDQWYKDMAYINVYQNVNAHAANLTYWTGWPTNNNLYIQPNNWWGSFMFVIGKLKPTGAK